MATDIFMKLGDIKGESLDDKHKGEIEVMSYSWGVTNAGSMGVGSGGGEEGNESLAAVGAAAEGKVGEQGHSLTALEGEGHRAECDLSGT